MYWYWPYPIPLFAIIIVYSLTPSFLDHFYIHKEMKYIFILLCFNYAAFYGCESMAAYYINKWSKMRINILMSIMYHCFNGAQFAVVMIATYWVNKKVTKIIDRDRFNTSQIHITFNKVSSNSINMELVEVRPKNAGRQTKEYVSKIEKSLLEFLSNSLAFEAFMTYLSYEFSMENLLSFVEFVQFQKYAADTMGRASIQREEDLLCDMLILPDTVPLSEIVHDGNMCLKKKALLLYQKYIADGSIYMINIPFRVKQELRQIMDQYRMDIDECIIEEDDIIDTDILMVFDDCCKKIQQIMNGTYGRYKSTPQYHNIVSKILFV